MSDNHSRKDKTAFYALLAKYKAKPPKGGKEWAHNNWFNLENVIDRINSLQHDIKLKPGRNKTILCSVLGACLTAAVETRLKQKSQEQTVTDSLQNPVEILQKQLDEERNKNHVLRDEFNILKNSLRQEHTQTSKHTD